MTPKELRDTLEATLQPYLGTYTLPNGRRHPAIAVVRGNEEYPQPGTEVKGLECTIFYPDLKPCPILDGYTVKQKWRIHLKQWDKKAELKKPQEAIMRSPLQAIISNILAIPAEERLGIPEAVQIEMIDFNSVG